MERVTTYFRDLKMQQRLMWALLAAGLIPVLVVALKGSADAGDALEDQAFSQLEAVRSIKVGQISGYFGERMADLAVLANNPFTKRALADLEEAATAAEANGNREQAMLRDESYAPVHAEYYSVFEQYMEEYGYYDIFLLSKGSGHVVFTVVKEPDFGTHLSRESHGLAEAAPA